MGILKNLILCFIFPLPLSFFVLFLGLTLLWFTKKQKLGKIAVTFGFLILALSSLFFLSSWFVGILENKYPVLRTDEGFENEIKGVHTIVVLGAGYYNDPSLSPTSRQTQAQLYRTIEGLYLHKAIKDSTLIVSGGGKKKVLEAQVMADLLVSLGVDLEKITVEDKSQNTYEEALYLKDSLGDKPFILVTSAVHMKRAVALFRKMGMNPVPAPTDHRLRPFTIHPEQLFLPTSQTLQAFENALYEYLGLIKEWSLGRV